jgi:hypothetical protein
MRGQPDCDQTVAVLLDGFREACIRPLSSGNTKWGSRGLNPGPTDYENVQTLFEGVRHGPFRAQDTDIQAV